MKLTCRTTSKPFEIYTGIFFFKRRKHFRVNNLINKINLQGLSRWLELSFNKNNCSLLDWVNIYSIFVNNTRCLLLWFLFVLVVYVSIYVNPFLFIVDVRYFHLLQWTIKRSRRRSVGCTWQYYYANRMYCYTRKSTDFFPYICSSLQISVLIFQHTV